MQDLFVVEKCAIRARNAMIWWLARTDFDIFGHDLSNPNSIN